MAGLTLFTHLVSLHRGLLRSELPYLTSAGRLESERVESRQGVLLGERGNPALE